MRRPRQVVSDRGLIVGIGQQRQHHASQHFRREIQEKGRSGVDDINSADIAIARDLLDEHPRLNGDNLITTNQPEKGEGDATYIIELVIPHYFRGAGDLAIRQRVDDSVLVATHSGQCIDELSIKGSTTAEKEDGHEETIQVYGKDTQGFTEYYSWAGDQRHQRASLLRCC